MLSIVARRHRQWCHLIVFIIVFFLKYTVMKVCDKRLTKWITKPQILITEHIHSMHLPSAYQLDTTTPCTCQKLILHYRFRKYLYYKVSHVILCATVLIFFISLLLKSFFIETVTIRRALIVQNICLNSHPRLTIRKQMSITEQTHPDQTTESLKEIGSYRLWYVADRNSNSVDWLSAIELNLFVKNMECRFLSDRFQRKSVKCSIYFEYARNAFALH